MAEVGIVATSQLHGMFSFGSENAAGEFTLLIGMTWFSDWAEHKNTAFPPLPNGLFQQEGESPLQKFVICFFYAYKCKTYFLRYILKLFFFLQ